MQQQHENCNCDVEGKRWNMLSSFFPERARRAPNEMVELRLKHTTFMELIKVSSFSWMPYDLHNNTEKWEIATKCCSLQVVFRNSQERGIERSNYSSCHFIACHHSALIWLPSWSENSRLLSTLPHSLTHSRGDKKETNDSREQPAY